MKTLIVLFAAFAMPFFNSHLNLAASTAPADLKSAPGGAYLVIAEKFGGDITRDEIASHSKLGVMGCAEGAVIYRFTLELEVKGKKKQFAGDSNTLSSEMRVALESLKKGDEFTFRRVKARIGDDDFDRIEDSHHAIGDFIEFATDGVFES